MNRLLIAAFLLSATGAAVSSPPPQNYPFRVRAIRVVQDPAVAPPSGGEFGEGADMPTWHGSAAIFDESGPLEELQFKHVDSNCFYRRNDLFFQVGGFYPARWMNDHEVAMVTDISRSGKIHECTFRVKRSRGPDTAESRRLTALGPEKMAKVYAMTSVTNPPARPVSVKVGLGVVSSRGPTLYGIDAGPSRCPCPGTIP
jgi:hypothetical protein